MFGHDSGIFFIDNVEKALFGLATERVTRLKHDGSLCYPTINVLKQLCDLSDGIELLHSYTEVDYYVGYYPTFTDFQLRKILTSRKSSRKQKFEQLAFHKPLHLVYLPIYDKLIPRSWKVNWSDNKEKVAEKCKKNIKAKTDVVVNHIGFENHHLCHAASSFFFSPFKEALCVTLDGYGDNASSRVYLGRKERFERIALTEDKLYKGCSVGRFYTTITRILGIIPFSDEGKVEALASYGSYKNKLYDFLKRNSHIKSDSEISIELSGDLAELNFDEIRLTELRAQLGDSNVAAAVQKWLEEIGVEYIQALVDETKMQNLCFSGGVFANVKLNQKIFELLKPNMYIFPAMGDMGTAAGAEALRTIDLGGDISWLKGEEMPYWGTDYTVDKVKDVLKKSRLPFEYLGENWWDNLACLIAKGNVVSLFHGKMEYGPRALGNRSLLADPRDSRMKDIINTTMKRREWYQPFCPSILEEERTKYFNKSYKNKHMTCAFSMKEEYQELLPAVIHVDGTARPQFVEKHDNPSYYMFLEALKQEIDYGVVLNTSFNLHGRAIVMTPEDAIQDFVDCGLDYLVMEGYLVKRK